MSNQIVKIHVIKVDVSIKQLIKDKITHNFTFRPEVLFVVCDEKVIRLSKIKIKKIYNITKQITEYTKLTKCTYQVTIITDMMTYLHDMMKDLYVYYDSFWNFIPDLCHLYRAAINI